MLFTLFQPLSYKRLFFGASLFVLALLFLSPAHAAFASSHEAGFPPFPYLITGTVEVDGSFLDESSGLTARVGDWESRPVTVTEGSFGNAPGIPIVVGPPNTSYAGQTVSFHLPGGSVADQSFTFELLAQPAFLEQNLTFASSPATPAQPALAPGVPSDSQTSSVILTNSSSSSLPAGRSFPTSPISWAAIAVLGIMLIVSIAWLRSRKRSV